MISENARITTAEKPGSDTRLAEIFAFTFLAVLIWPVLAVAVVGGYGFVVWMLQMILGPPGPPH